MSGCQRITQPIISGDPEPGLAVEPVPASASSLVPGVVLDAGLLSTVDLVAEGFRPSSSDEPPRWVDGLAVRLPDRFGLEVLRRDLEVIGVADFETEHPTEWFDEALNLGHLNVVVAELVGRVPVIA